MRILLWGCISSPWTIWFSQEFLLKYNYEVWIVETSIKKEYLNFFKHNNIHIIKCPQKVVDWYAGGKKGSCFRTLFINFLQFKTVLKSGQYDVINLHFVDWFDIVVVTFLRMIKRSKLILSYWGSDLLRVGDKTLWWEGLFAKYADYVTFDNEDLRTKFEKTYKWAYKVKKKTVLFGLPILNIINEKSKQVSVSEIRKKWDVPLGKKVIAIGYNGIPEQQHIEVLRCIENLKSDFKSSIFLLLQMSYGGTEEYREKVAEAVQKTGCQYRVIQHFLSDDEVADLRIITDIFINAQITDAFSGSVCENLFSGTLLINAEWLRYREFEKYDFRFSEFGSFAELGKCLYDAIENEYDLSENKKLVWNLRSWECCAPRWEQVYRELLNA